MINILIFGAGKSSSYLTRYLLENAPHYNWSIKIADYNLEAAIERVGKSEFGDAIQLDIHDEIKRKLFISNAHFVVSLLPPTLHIIVAKDCLEFNKNLVTASYISEEIKQLHQDAQSKKLLFMNEIGLDPGLDHLSAMKIIHEVERLGGDIDSFKSYCGGLVSPQSDDNPWHYKVSWNVNNIVNAGKSGAEFLLNGIKKQLSYEQIFKEIEIIEVPNLGKLAAYANRDSLHYQNIYGLDSVKTLLRATFRYEDFCIAWNVIVNLGLIENSTKYDTTQLTFKDWFYNAAKMKAAESIQYRIESIESKHVHLCYEMLEWLGIFSNELIPMKGEFTSAQILQNIIEEKWKMHPKDKDMIVMHHEFEYTRKKIKTKLCSTLIVNGEDKTYTAMAKTVGLPMAIYTKLFLTGKIENLYGVQIPIQKEIYKPILKELVDYGIEFEETYIA